MPNIKSAINSHNTKILRSPVNNQRRTCINKSNCPLQEKCLSQIHYIKQILVRKTFKQKFIMAYQKQNLKQDIRTIKNPSTTKSTKMTLLSNELWKIKASKEEPVLVWKILGQYQPYNVNTKRCLLCLNEKLQIAIYRGNNMLNKRTEITNKCRHRNKYSLASYDSID